MRHSNLQWLGYGRGDHGWERSYQIRKQRLFASPISEMFGRCTGASLLLGVYTCLGTEELPGNYLVARGG